MVKSFSIKGIENDFVYRNNLVIHTETGDFYNVYMNGTIGIVLREDMNILNIDIGNSLLDDLKDATELILCNKPYSLWKNGNIYYTHGVVMDLLGNIHVYYQGLYNGSENYYIRPIKSFVSEIPKSRKRENVTNQRYRFELIDLASINKK